MKRCTLVVPDAGPFNSLWVADELELLLKLDMPIVVVDAVHDEMTSDPANYLKDREVLDFIANHQPPFVRVRTDIWMMESERRRRGEKPKRNAGELAIADFLSSEDGLKRYVRHGDPVLLLYEDRDVRVINKPPNMHLLSTVGLVKGLERLKMIPSADDVIRRMTHPTAPGRRPTDARVLTDLPDGTDEPAATGSSWTP
ncbi:hypothetical protein [Methylobacterium segetis]|uniref:hypothetical protein n=1 Tax=Methylobacterium segetis TaxID=2488750 RepID=UPI0010503D14|nr:hypothetical protein [Methylobacterium segetis]